MVLRKVLFLTVLSLVVPLSCLSAQDLPVTSNATPALKSPCAQVSHLYSQRNLTVVSAELAYKCLKSVPLHVAEAKQLHSSLVPYLKWHTTFSYLQDPPIGYRMPAYDFWAAFDRIGLKLSKAAYESEWDFGMDLHRTLNNAHDNHLGYSLDIVGKPFSFGRNISLVSLSKDGHSLPQVYVHDDIQNWFHHSAPFPAAVMAINGRVVGSYFKNWMRVSWHQDPDAFYNSLFWSPAQNTLSTGSDGYVQGLFGGSGMGQVLYPGATTSLLFVNGTTTTYQNFAKLNVDFTGIDDGESFYQKFCTGDEDFSSTGTTTETTPTNDSNTTPEPPAITTATPGYPLPVIRHPQNLIAGYYVNSSSYDKIAILSISNFVSSDGGPDQTNFQNTTQEFLRLAKCAGTTKLILDLRGNPGGTILQAFDLFKQLFPHLEPWGASRFRAFDTLNAVGEQLSNLSNTYYSGLNTTPTHFQAAHFEPFNYHLDMNAQSHNFSNWSSLYGPISIPNRDTFTNLIRYNLSSPLLVDGLGINITGYPSPPHPVSPPFSPRDIIMLHDGLCASTCATLSDLLRTQAHIRSVVMGGRPQHTPMQAVGGTRGMETYTFAYIYDLMQLAWQSGSPTQQARWNLTAPDLGTISREPMRRWAREGWGTMNVRDSVLEENAVGDGDGSGVPSHFLWVPADCRLWYSAEMVEDVTAVWRRVGDVAWGRGRGRGRCVVGGL